MRLIDHCSFRTMYNENSEGYNLSVVRNSSRLYCQVEMKFLAHKKEIA